VLARIVQDGLSAVEQKCRAYISFDYDYDRDLKNLLLGQSRNDDSPFFIEDWSIKKATPSWQADARKRIRRSNVVIVICGRQTHQAVGVTREIEIAREENIRFFLLRGRKDAMIRRPMGTSWWSEDLHTWTWNNLKRLTSPNPTPWWKTIW